MTRDEYLNGGYLQSHKRGADLPQSRLNPQIVRNIRASERTSTDLAREIGVHRRTIEGVRSYRTWRHVL